MTPDQMTYSHRSILKQCVGGAHQFFNSDGVKAAELCRHGYLTAHSIPHERRALGGVEYLITPQGEAAMRFWAEKT